MEIEHCLPDWPKAIWFLLFTFWCSVAMGTTYDVTQLSSPKNDSKNFSSLRIANSTTVVSLLNSTFLNDTLEEDCWSEDNITLEEFECLSNLAPPPNIEDLPPPPLPPFLKELELLLHQSGQNFELLIQEFVSNNKDDESEEEEDLQKSKVALFEDANCPLCQWSIGNNDTLLLFKNDDEEESSERGSSPVMIWVLIGVAILSATVGAFLTGIFFKCRRKNVISICSKSSPSENTSPQERSSNSNVNLNSKLGILRFSFRKMGICSKKSSLDPYRAESIQNTYSESPYINTDSSSTMYAEINTPLNGVCASSNINSGQPCSSSDAYSEVPDPFSKSPNTPNCDKLSSQGIYCNSNYVTSEGSSEQNESSGGSTSTPSSAYYSDVSTSLEVHVSKKKKKKRKSEDKSLRLAPSQRLRKNYLPTSRSQRDHPCSSNERFLQNLRERNQNYYCTGNLVQNLVAKSRNDAISTDPGPSIAQEGFTSLPSSNVIHSQGCILQENRGSTVNKVPLCLHFGNICSEQGHIINEMYTGENQTLDSCNPGQCGSKNNSCNMNQASDVAYADNLYSLENLCSTRAGCLHTGCTHTCDAVYPQPPQIAEIYHDKTGCYRFNSQNIVSENGFSRPELPYIRQCDTRGCRCSLGKTLCCDRESMRKNVHFPQQEIAKNPEWNPIKDDLYPFHKHFSTEAPKECHGTCDYNPLIADSQYVYTDGQINNANIYFIKNKPPDSLYQHDEQNPNIFLSKNMNGENIYFTKAQVCGSAIPNHKNLNEPSHSSQDAQQQQQHSQHRQHATSSDNNSQVVQQLKNVNQGLANVSGQQNENFNPTLSEYI